MPLSWNEIKDRALKFSKDWGDVSRERAEKDSFWNEFFNVFGIDRKRVATFEEPVKKLGDKQGFIDLFWKGHLLIEHKSAGKDLDKAYEQALDYFPGLKEEELPKYIIVCDFERLRLYDLEEKTNHEFRLMEFYKNVKLFGFIAGYQKRTFKEEDPVNIKAAELMGKFHDQLKDFGYKGHQLEVYLVRLLFVLFADDTGIFEKDIFKYFLEQKTNEDGSDLGGLIAQFFQVLNTPREDRLSNLDEDLNNFPYINGKLFEENLPIAAFNSKMRKVLIDASALDWGQISPAIFGSLFQSVMDPEQRRNLGAHYTSEKNIMKLIKPLFLDELRAEFEKVKKNKPKLKEFHEKLSKLQFLDPACGSGNFLIITYRELRQLEIEILRELHKEERVLNIADIIWVDVDQFYGIEYDEFPARIAGVAMWLIDHQMNMKISEEFGQYYVRLPLKKAAKIVNDNALRINWEDVVPKDELSYILGNPPFYGSRNMNAEQKEDFKLVFAKYKIHGTLDYVAGWYYKAVKFIQGTNIKAAFVSTNSISQGIQVPDLWNILNTYSVEINFAHTTFKWFNKARQNAAVHVVIIGFAEKSIKNKVLYTYNDINDDEPSETIVKQISPYLIQGLKTIISKRSNPICDVSQMMKGNAAIDDGNFILTDVEKEKYLNEYPELSNLIKEFIGSQELIRGFSRYCFWLDGASPNELKHKVIKDRIEKIQNWRAQSKKAATRKWAEYPSQFMENRQPKSDYLMIPVVSSERRKYIPIGFLTKDIIANYSSFILPNASLFEFGFLSSIMHMTWVKYTCGRLESRFRYSNTLVYNNYPWPKDPSDKNKSKVEKKAQKVLDVRAEFPDSSLADLYDPLTMPPKLVKAHQELDKSVDLCYRPQPFTTESNRIEFLFNLYEEYVAREK